jgi:hypothetical protein
MSKVCLKSNITAKGDSMSPTIKVIVASFPTYEDSGMLEIFPVQIP